MTTFKEMDITEVESEIALLAIVSDAVVAAQDLRDRKSGRRKPTGIWDNAGRYTPDDLEWASCCAGIRSPSRAWPFPLWRHVHTAVHVATKYGVDRRDLNRATRLLQRRSELLGQNAR